MRYTVALTGGIGSGKSTVANAFADLGIQIVDADIIARQVVEPGKPALDAIAEHFGPELISADGTLHRRLLRERIFAHPQRKPGSMPCFIRSSSRRPSVSFSRRRLHMYSGLCHYWLKTAFIARQIACSWSMSPPRRSFPGLCSATTLRARMLNRFSLPRRRVKRALPWQTMLLIIMAHQTPSCRMSPACTHVISNLRRSLSHRKNRNAHPGPF